MKNQLVLVSKKPKTTITFYVLLIIPIICSSFIYIGLNHFEWFNLRDYFYLISIFSLAFYIYLFFKELFRNKYKFKLIADDEYIYLYESKLEKYKLLKKYKIKNCQSVIYDRRHLEKVIHKKTKKVSYVSRPSYILKFEIDGEFESIYVSKLLFDKENIMTLVDFCRMNNDKIKVKI